MRNKTGPSLYHMTDKNIYDALQHKKVTIDSLHESLLHRGIFLSSDANKHDVTEYICGISHDYYDYKNIATQIESVNRKEPYTNSVITLNLDGNEIKKYCDKVVTSRSESGGEVLKVTQSGKLTVITATYTEIDYSKTELRQRTTKNATIELERDGDELIIRQQANKKAAEISEQLKELIIGEAEEEVEERIISLESIVDPEARSFFFDQLIKSVPNYKLDNVLQVDVKYSSKSDDDDSEEHDDNGELLGHIQKAVLNGEGVLQSAEFTQLHEAGFYITKITWRCTDILPGGDKVEFSASFGNPEKCTDYKYMVRYIFGSKGAGEFNRNGRTPSNTERTALTKLLEQASSTAYDAVLGEYGVDDMDGVSEPDEVDKVV